MVSYRVVAVVAGNSEAVTLSGLRADTQYQLVVTAVRSGKKFRSRPIVFRTLGKLRRSLVPTFYPSIETRLTLECLEPPRTSPQQDAAVTGGPLPPPPPSSQQPQAYIQVDESPKDSICGISSSSSSSFFSFLSLFSPLLLFSSRSAAWKWA